MNKYDFELQKLQIRSVNFGNFLTLVKHGLTMGTIIGCVYLIFAGMTAIAAASPDSVNALAILAEKMNIGTWLGTIGTIAGSSAWYLERKGKKRLLRGYGDQRQDTEANDAYRSSSGLDETGGTPTPNRR